MYYAISLIVKKKVHCRYRRAPLRAARRAVYCVLFHGQPAHVRTGAASTSSFRHANTVRLIKSWYFWPDMGREICTRCTRTVPMYTRRQAPPEVPSYTLRSHSPRFGWAATTVQWIQLPTDRRRPIRALAREVAYRVAQLLTANCRIVRFGVPDVIACSTDQGRQFE